MKYKLICYPMSRLFFAMEIWIQSYVPEATIFAKLIIPIFKNIFSLSILVTSWKSFKFQVFISSGYSDSKLPLIPNPAKCDVGVGC